MALQPIADGKIFDPNTKIKATTGNYKNAYNFADQFYPDTKDELFRVRGDQSITGLLETLSMEEMLHADLTIWSEDGRRRKRHAGVTRTGNVYTYVAHAIRLNDYIVISDKTGSKVEYGLVTEVTDNTFTASCASAAAWTVGAVDLIAFTVGSEFKKGTAGKAKALTREVNIYSTSPVIMKDMYEETGSDLPNICWINDPAGNPYWYIREEQEAMFRFLDNCESQMILQDKYNENSDLVTAGYKGTQGLFPSIRDRGNTFGGKISSIADMDSIVKRLDKVSGQSNNMLFISTDHSLGIDDTLAAVNQYDATGSNYGVFSDSDMEKVLHLGFKGFDRASYSFYKQTWKFLKDDTMFDPENFAAGNQVHGIMVPVGQTSVRNTIEGNKIETIPFLSLLYKGNASYSRKLVTNFHGSQMVPDATDTTDVYGVNWLTERTLRPVGMLRWMLFEGN